MAELCLVTGGTGMVGPAVVRRLVDNGWHVRLLSRTAPHVAPHGVEVVRGDIGDHATIRAALDGVAVVHHLAGRAHVSMPTADDWREYERVNVAGTASIVDAAVAAGVKRFVHYSTIAVYGPTSGGTPVDESAPLAPADLYARSKATGEALVGSATILHPTILRLAAVYGPRLRSNYARLADTIRRGRYLQVGPGANRRTLVFDEDVAQIAALAASHAAAADRTFNVTDGRVHTVREIVAAISVATGRTPSTRSLPIAPFAAAAGALEAARRIGLPGPQLRQLLDKYLEDVAVLGDRAQSELGYRPVFDLEAGWRSVLARSAP